MFNVDYSTISSLIKFYAMSFSSDTTGSIPDTQIWRSSRQLLVSSVARQPASLGFFILLFPFLLNCLRNKVLVLRTQPTLCNSMFRRLDHSR